MSDLKKLAGLHNDIKSELPGDTRIRKVAISYTSDGSIRLNKSSVWHIELSPDELFALLVYFKKVFN